MKVTSFLSFGYLVMSWVYNIFSLIANKLRTTSMAISELYCFKIVFIFIPLCMHVCVWTCPHVCTCTGTGARNGCWVPWSWRYYWLYSAGMGVGNQIRSSARAADSYLLKLLSILCIPFQSAFHWTVFFCIFFFVFLHVKLKHHFCATDIRSFINTLTWNNFLLKEAIVLP